MRFFDAREEKLENLTIFRPLPKALLPAAWTSQSTEWLAAIGQAKLYLKWRPFGKLEDSIRGTQVMEIPLSKVRHYSRTESYIRLKLAKDLNSRPLERRLMEERSKLSKAQRAAQPLPMQYPVGPSGRRGIRLQWNAYPSAEHFLRLLETYGVRPMNGKERGKPPLTFLLPPWNHKA